MLIVCVTENYTLYPLHPADTPVRGLYRTSASTIPVNEIKEQFNENPHKVDLSKCTDVHIVTGVLKRYLRELPNPVISLEMYDEFLAAISKSAFSSYPVKMHYP